MTDSLLHLSSKSTNHSNRQKEDQAVLMLVSVETELILAEKLLFFFFPILEKTALCFFSICVISIGQNLSQGPQFLCLVPMRVRIGCLTCAYSTHPKSKKEHREFSYRPPRQNHVPSLPFFFLIFAKDVSENLVRVVSTV